MFNSKKHLAEVKLTILGENGGTIGVKTEEGQLTYWDLMVDNNQQVQINISVPEESSTVGIDAFGCVALIIGKIENEGLVSIG